MCQYCTDKFNCPLSAKSCETRHVNKGSFTQYNPQIQNMALPEHGPPEYWPHFQNMAPSRIRILSRIWPFSVHGKICNIWLSVNCELQQCWLCRLCSRFWWSSTFLSYNGLCRSWPVHDLVYEQFCLFLQPIFLQFYLNCA